MKTFSQLLESIEMTRNGFIAIPKSKSFKVIEIKDSGKYNKTAEWLEVV